MVRNGKMDFKRLGETVSVGVRFLDDVIDVNCYPFPQIERISKANRKIGLGIIGLARMFAKLEIPYSFEEAVKTAADVMRYVSEKALEASRRLSQERGPSPNFEKSIYVERGEPAVRNAGRTTVSPTGTISIIANISSGIEPIIAVTYARKALDREFLVLDPVFREMAEARGIYSDELDDEIAAKGSLVGIEGVPDDLKMLFETASPLPFSLFQGMP